MPKPKYDTENFIPRDVKCWECTRTKQFAWIKRLDSRSIKELALDIFVSALMFCQIASIILSLIGML